MKTVTLRLGQDGVLAEQRRCGMCSDFSALAPAHVDLEASWTQRQPAEPRGSAQSRPAEVYASDLRWVAAGRLAFSSACGDVGTGAGGCPDG